MPEWRDQQAPAPPTEPFHWWGQVWTPPNPMSLTEVVASGAISTDLAALTTLLVEAGVSLLVAGERTGMGKSTLLAALSAVIEPSRKVFFPRGRYESFAEIDQAQPQGVTLMINEISSHLPVYHWGDSLLGCLRVRNAGGQLLATTHGGSPAEVVQLLAGYPMDLDSSLIAGLDLLLLLEPTPGLPAPARAIQLVGLMPASGSEGIELAPLASLESGVNQDEVQTFMAHRLAVSASLETNLWNRTNEINWNDSRWQSIPVLFAER